MTRAEAMDRTAALISQYVEVDENVLYYISEKIYADVVATAVDDERSLWVTVTARNDSDIRS